MRGELERLARRVWSRELDVAGRLFGFAAAPVAWFWDLGLRWRALRLAKHPPVRIGGGLVVSVGNLAVGGTGKTPLARWAADRLERYGVPTAVLVGGKGDDEALLHRSWSAGRVVIAARDRLEGARLAWERGARALVLDDGFQSRTLARDVDLVLVAADDPFPGPLLPRGPYRERPQALARAHAVVVTRRASGPEGARALAHRVEAYAPGKVLASAHLAPRGWRRLDGRDGVPERGGVLALCGIARPDTFARTVWALLGGPVELRAFPDHHDFTGADVRRAEKRARGRPIVVTEKDAVKLARWADELRDVYVLEEELRWDWGEKALAELLARALASVRGPDGASGPDEEVRFSGPRAPAHPAPQRVGAS